MKTFPMTSAARRATRPAKPKRERPRHYQIDLLSPSSAGLQLSAKEFDSATFDEETAVRYELINGILVVTPMPLPQERDPNEELGYFLRQYQKEHLNGKHLDKTLHEHDLYCGDQRRRVDRVIWVGLGRRPHPVDDIPAIVIEFVSEGKRNWLRDYEEKRDEYLAVGVKEYWIIDRFNKTLTVFLATGKRYKKKVVEAKDTYMTPLLPGFSLIVEELLSIAQEWDEEPRK
jgi:Uma2 family endonuclease